MSLLLSNKTNLLPALIKFIQNSESITLYSAYIKKDLLKEIIKQSDGRIKQIVVRWRMEDLISGGSDIGIYQLCKENNIILFRNTKLHAKCVINEKGDCILGSANFTNSGMLKLANSNWEINTQVSQVDLDSRVILQSILLESELVMDDFVTKLEEMLDQIKPNTFDFEMPSYENSDFLISLLPMCYHPEVIYEIKYENKIVPYEEFNAASHDLALYQMLDHYSSKEEFLSVLDSKFNQHPFIQKLIGFIRNNGSCNYGTVVRWIQNNCTEVPIPRSWELKKSLVVNILYEWICYFNSEFQFIRKYPNGSDIIQHKDNVE